MAVLNLHARSIGLFAFLAAIAASALWLDWPVTVLSKEEVVQTALKPVGNNPLPSDRIVAVKLIHRYDLALIMGPGERPDDKPWDRVWVVDLKGMLIAPSEPGSRITYTVEVIPDRKPATIEIYDENGPGDRPTHWDELWSLAD